MQKLKFHTVSRGDKSKLCHFNSISIFSSTLSRKSGPGDVVLSLPVEGNTSLFLEYVPVTCKTMTYCSQKFIRYRL